MDVLCVLLHGTASRYCFTVLLHGTASRYCFTVLLHGTALFFIHLSAFSCLHFNINASALQILTRLSVIAGFCLQVLALFQIYFYYFKFSHHLHQNYNKTINKTFQAVRSTFERRLRTIVGDELNWLPVPKRIILTS